ncbi:MAG: methylmalonyl-CoA mutase [Deltaproteobacteria bacterium CG_4_8_14_3_um_filter_51_11]|nr:methylmalonyl-CoA mutase [bacterium]OIP41476.1 MAG: methylmalonyl-CoA mutase [Desulfobacteraceae bacterium CG2_30_51_40]PIP46865.1 MAG: methylmalonyl-CoA mutase [Deltaproteobacteria bacterium CG23_combo_of_CG06-09_8_20_14_all_51_20]PIX18894.1 MAG: methylmalonyl-CoA mutase [Deltaproteobacteria bacterium CG_4_8_14_3_um_filter_51_11]PJB38325.1 MAG: methylmalonyl-CoA mutase [Deltaproteobacteria bacterium CG_4_9_14_3_um_filter_51_14]
MGVATYIKDEKDAVKEVILQSGIKVKPVYTPDDLAAVGFDYKNDLGEPGEFPFTRSIHPLGYRSRNWTTRQYTGFGTPEQTNERFKLMIAHGQTGLNVAFDLPTQMGYDSDNPMSEGEVGRVGMAVDSLRDFEIAFKDIKLDRIGSGLTINAVASVMLAMYQSVAERFGYDKNKISATPQNDILKEMVGRGAWIYPVGPAVRLVGDTIEYAMKALPRCNPVSVCGYHIRESGCTPAQEISYAFMIAFAYIDNVVARGYRAEEFVGGFTFNLNIYGNLWETVAKFRAARKLWARLLRDRYGVKDKKALFLRGIFGGGGSGMTKQQPENNIMRGAYYALAAALSGAQTTALCSFDEAYTIPTERAALLSLRTFQILMDEIGLRDTVDPLAGSYFMETLTKQMEEKILEEMEKVKKVGGMVEAVASGYVQREVARQAYEYEKRLQDGAVTKVGVNKYTEGVDMEVELHEYNEDWAMLQIERLKKLKQERDKKAAGSSLKALEDAAREGSNVMPHLVECCKSLATVGEMADVFRNVFGEHREPSIF